MFDVSIPYGSIRSDSEIRILQLQQVSIPYGSIRSAVASAADTCFVHVSIPYGSIRRPPCAPYLSYFSWVSIPYGSIRRCSGCCMSDCPLCFNSLWFD